MYKKIDVQGNIEIMTHDVAEAMEVEQSRVASAIIMQSPPVRAKGPYLATLNGREMASVNALICWVAANSNVSEDVVREQVTRRFDRLVVEDIPATHFDLLVKYLVDLRVCLN